MKTMNKLVSFIAMAMLSVSALADKEPQQGFYISPEISAVTYRDYCKTIFSIVPQATCSESEIGFGLIGGYQLTDFVAVEAGVLSVSGFDASKTVSGVNYKLDIDYSSVSLGGAYRVPIGERFAITGKVGYHFWDTKAKLSGGGAFLSFSDDSGTDIYLGGGLEFIASDNISFRSEYTQYKLDGDDLDVISVRLIISF